MTSVRSLAALLTALLVAISPPCAASPFAINLGGVRLGLDAPPGFSDTSFTGSPRLIELAESLTSASNRILLFAIDDADLRRFMVGDRPELRRYMIAVTPKGLERAQVSAAMFSTFVTDSLRELGPPAPAGDYRKYLETHRQGKASLLVELRRDTTAVSVLQGTRLPSLDTGWSEKPQYLLSTTSLIHLRGKAVNLAVYTGYDRDEDLEWIQYITRRWIEEIQRLNR